MEEKKKFGKMKAVGYSCILFAAVLSVLMLIPKLDVDQGIGLPLVYFWAGTGITLLFGNAGKRIGGSLAEGKVYSQVQGGNK